MTGKFDLTNGNNMAFYISGPKLLFETTEISTHPNSTQQESNYVYLYTTKIGISIKIWLYRKFESTEFKTMRVNCIYKHVLFILMSLYKCKMYVSRVETIWESLSLHLITWLSVFNVPQFIAKLVIPPNYRLHRRWRFNEKALYLHWFLIGET